MNSTHRATWWTAMPNVSSTIRSIGLSHSEGRGGPVSRGCRLPLAPGHELGPSGSLEAKIKISGIDDLGQDLNALHQSLTGRLKIRVAIHYIESLIAEGRTFGNPGLFHQRSRQTKGFRQRFSGQHEHDDVRRRGQAAIFGVQSVSSSYLNQRRYAFAGCLKGIQALDAGDSG